MTWALGTRSCSSASRFAASGPENKPMPVRLLFGLFKLVTRPRLTGSPLLVKTIGIVFVTFLAASAAALALPMIKATRRSTRSAARDGSRS